MLLFLLAPPAMTAQPVAPAQTLEGLQELLEAIPEALIGGKPAGMGGLVTKALAGWEQAKPELQKALPGPELVAAERQLKAMKTLKPREQAVGALSLSSLLSRHQPRSRQRDLLGADRTTMLAWCYVDAGLWQQVPRVADAFKPVIEQDKGQHVLAVVGVQKALKQLQESQAKRQPQAAKRALRDLLGLVDVLEKP